MSKHLAEAIGTFVLVLAGTGAIVVDQESAGAVTHVGVALTFGLVVMSMVHAFGDVSGAHLNPAVTIGFVLSGRFPGRRAGGYILAQVVGALAATGVLRVLFPDSLALGATTPSGEAWRSLVLEALLTFILMLVILRVSTGPKEKGITAAIAIGGVIGFEALFAGPISGASMNPARSLAPALVTMNLADLWIYLVAPVLGAALAVACDRGLGAARPEAQASE